MQVLPGRFGGKFDENLNLDDSEHRRKQAAVEVKKSRRQHFSRYIYSQATLRTMKDLAKQDTFHEQVKIRVKIQETVSL